jgi:outer membrane protein W
MHRLKQIVLGMAVIALLAASPVMAQENTFKVFATANWISPLSESDVTFGSVQDSVSAANALGYEAGFEWRLHKIVGLEGSYLVASNDFDFGNTNIGSLDSNAITAALNFHILPTKHFDLWVAPVASWYHFKDFELDSSVGGGTTSINDEWGYGAAVGFDIGFGKMFAITAGLRYVKLAVSSDSSGGVDNVDINPLISRVGIAFRFGTR